jgi:hypothetical protein
MRITADQIISWRPCPRYPDDRVHQLGPAIGLTPLEIAALDIPHADRVWVLLRPEVLGEHGLQVALDRIAVRAVTNHALHCGVPAVERWAQGWLDGTDRTEAAATAAWETALAAAWAARAAAREAWAAARATAAAAARDTAWAAAWAARAAAREAWAAARATAAAAAAWETARETAVWAARDTAWAAEVAERMLQLYDIVHVLEGRL